MKALFQLVIPWTFLALLGAGEKPMPAAEPVGKGVFVAVGYGGRRVSSADGVTWRHDTEWAANGGDDDRCLFSVVHARGRFFAVGGGASEGHVVVSADGKEWKEVYRARTRVVPILFGNDRFVAGSGRDLLTSGDGEHWRRGGPLPYERGIYFRRGAFGNGVFVLAGDCDVKPGAPRNGWRCATTDGGRVRAFCSSLPNTRSLAFGAGRFVLVGEKGYRASSADGLHWEESCDAKEDFRQVFWTGKQFILSCDRHCLTSRDGKSWKRAGPSLPCEVLCMGNGVFIGASWKTNLWRSADGLRWERTSTAGTNAITAGAYGVPAPAGR